MFILCMAAFFLIVLCVDDLNAVDIGARAPGDTPFQTGRSEAECIASTLGRRSQIMAEGLRQVSAC
jgi:hypothetical protein